MACYWNRVYVMLASKLAKENHYSVCNGVVDMLLTLHFTVLVVSVKVNMAVISKSKEIISLSKAKINIIHAKRCFQAFDHTQ